MVIAQEPAQWLAAPHRSFALPIGYPRKQQDVALPLMIPLGMEMVEIVAQCPRNERSPKRITLDRHSSLTDLTQRSA
jgi:hypothetical protein